MGEFKSTIGFVASYDQGFTSFNSFAGFQDLGHDHIVISKDVSVSCLVPFARAVAEPMAPEQLMSRACVEYKNINHKFPDSVIVLRDAVADSQVPLCVVAER